MKKRPEHSNSNSAQYEQAERSNYHNPASTQHGDRKCDNCRYKVAPKEQTTFHCKECGTYNVRVLFEFSLITRFAIIALKISWRRTDASRIMRNMKISKPINTNYR